MTTQALADAAGIGYAGMASRIARGLVGGALLAPSVPGRGNVRAYRTTLGLLTVNQIASAASV